MKKVLSRICCWVLGALALLFVATCIRPPNGHCDFDLRMNELECLRAGVDPFSVWHEDVVMKPYCSNLPKKPIPEGCTKQVNAYVPWEYAYMLPISYLPRWVGWAVYCVLMGLAALFVLGLGCRADGPSAAEENDGFLSSAVALTGVSYLLWSNAAVGNFSVFVLAAAVAMAWSLSRGKDVLAGACWALAMVKPQSAILFAVPLLLCRKWITCLVAVGVCLVASLVPLCMCDSSFVDLLLHGPAANAELFKGCGTYPTFFLGTFGNGTEIGFALVIGLGLCLVMTWFVRRSDDWFVLLMPAAICAASWTYTQAYSHAMGWFVLFVLARERPRTPFLLTLLWIGLFVVSRWFLAWHGLCSYMGWMFPVSEYAFRCIDSLNSTASLLVAFLFCLYKANRQ